MAIRLVFIISFFMLTMITQAQYGNTLLWRIVHPITQKNSYLFGTLHVARLKYNNLNDSVYTAVTSCDKFYAEIIESNVSMLDVREKIEQFGLYMDSVMKTQRWKTLINNTAKRYNITPTKNDGSDIIDKINKEIYGELYKTEKGAIVVDNLLEQFATEKGLEIDQLETFDMQLNLLLDLVKIKLADTTINLLEPEESKISSLVFQHYENQDLNGLALIIDSLGDAYFLEKLLYERNVSMSKTMENAIQTKRCFFAVGAAHLVGNKGLISLLKNRGYIVTPVYSNIKIPYQYIKKYNKIWEKVMKKLAE